MSDVKKIIKPIVKYVALVAVFAAEGAHKISEANTRKKAMDAAVRKNNKKAKKAEKSEED